MSATSFRRAVETHLAEIVKELDGVDVAVLNKELGLAEQFAKVTTDGRVARGLENRIESLKEKIKDSKEPNKELTALRKSLTDLRNQMDKMDGYEFKARAKRGSKKSK